MLHDVVQRKKFYTLVLQKCLTRSISLNTRNRINEIKDEIVFLNLKNPEIRDVDKIWAEELFGDEANEILETAQSLLSFLAHRRNS